MSDSTIVPPSGPRFMWCFTLNNYTDEEYTKISDLIHSVKVKAGVVGKEVGETGTPHLQGCISFVKKIRFVQAKALICNRAHLQVAKGTWQQNLDYCTKQDKEALVVGGVASGQRNDIKSFVSWYRDFDGIPSRCDLLTEYPGILARHPRFVEENKRAKLQSLRPTPESFELRPWQQELVAYVKGPVSSRQIKFIVDPQGNAGKSYMADYLEAHFRNVQIMNPSKKADMAYEYDETTRIFILDCPRSKQGEFIQYDFLENIKDGRLFSPKYESYMKVFKSPHVIVFMNEDPDANALSSDRYDVLNV